jgi:hypothetical protein
VPPAAVSTLWSATGQCHLSQGWFEMSRLLSSPLITSRSIITAMLAESALCIMGILPVELVIFRWPTFFQIPPQLWRLVTPFFLTGGGINMLFDIYFSQLLRPQC